MPSVLEQGSVARVERRLALPDDFHVLLRHPLLRKPHGFESLGPCPVLVDAGDPPRTDVVDVALVPLDRHHADWLIPPRQVTITLAPQSSKSSSFNQGASTVTHPLASIWRTPSGPRTGSASAPLSGRSGAMCHSTSSARRPSGKPPRRKAAHTARTTSTFSVDTPAEYPSIKGPRATPPARGLRGPRSVRVLDHAGRLAVAERADVSQLHLEGDLAGRSVSGEANPQEHLVAPCFGP